MQETGKNNASTKALFTTSLHGHYCSACKTPASTTRLLYPMIISLALAGCDVPVVNDCEIKRAEYDNQIANKDYRSAAVAMRKCAVNLKNVDYKNLADAAEIQARIQDIKDKSKSAKNRIQEIESLEKTFPNEAKEFYPLKKSLTEQNAKDELQAARALKQKKKSEGVSIGMTKEDVLASNWGKPERVNTTTTSSGVREQWVYDGRNYLYFKDEILVSIQN